MKIGLVLNSTWNIVNFRQHLIKQLLKNNYEVVAIAPDDGYSKEVKALGCQFRPVNICRQGAHPLKDFSTIRKLYSIYKKEQLDLVLHFTIKPNIYGSIAAKLAGIPSINNVTGLGTVFLRSGIKSHIAQLLYKISFKYPKVIFFQNKDDEKLFLSKKLIKDSVTDLLPGSGIDLNHFIPSDTSKKGVFTFLMISRIMYDKGVVEYIEAAKYLKEKGFKVKFQLLGGSEKSKKLGIPKHVLDQWRSEGIIEYFGKVADVRPYIAAANAVVLPSYREGTPRSLIEAASMGKPIITTNVPGCKETVIHGYNGLLCEVKSSHDLAEKMIKMITLDEEKLKIKGINSRKLAESKFNQIHVFNKYQSAIDYCLQVKPQKKILKRPALISEA